MKTNHCVELLKKLSSTGLVICLIFILSSCGYSKLDCSGNLAEARIGRILSVMSKHANDFILTEIDPSRGDSILTKDGILCYKYINYKINSKYILNYKNASDAGRSLGLAFLPIDSVHILNYASSQSRDLITYNIKHDRRHGGYYVDFPKDVIIPPEILFYNDINFRDFYNIVNLASQSANSLSHSIDFDAAVFALTNFFGTTNNPKLTFVNVETSLHIQRYNGIVFLAIRSPNVIKYLDKNAIGSNVEIKGDSVIVKLKDTSQIKGVLQ